MARLPRGTRFRLRPKNVSGKRAFRPRPFESSSSGVTLPSAADGPVLNPNLPTPTSALFSLAPSELPPPSFSQGSCPLPSLERKIDSESLELSSSRATSAPEASLKLDAIESGYAVPLTRLNLHVWCIDLSIRPRRSAPRAREVAERAQSIERELSKEPTDPLLWADEAASRAPLPLLSAREAGPRTKLPDEEALERRDRGFPGKMV